jgi:hypothetical protein
MGGRGRVRDTLVAQAEEGAARAAADISPLQQCHVIDCFTRVVTCTCLAPVSHRHAQSE